MNEVEKNIIFIDGECILCDSLAQFVNNRDKLKVFYFSSLQGDCFKKIISKSKNKINSSDSLSLSTVILYYEGEVYYKSKAIIKILSKLPFPWKFFSFFIAIFPNFFRDIIYDFIAKIRYKIFEKKTTCELSEESFMDRLI